MKQISYCLVSILLLLSAMASIGADIDAGRGITIIDEQKLNPTQLKQYQNLLKELRCLVCQNQTLAESSAELAGDLRSIVFEMVLKGASDEKIYAFMTERYGDFIRYRPPLKAKTIPLWIAPFVVLLLLLIGVFLYLRKQNQASG